MLVSKFTQSHCISMSVPNAENAFLLINDNERRFSGFLIFSVSRYIKLHIFIVNGRIFGYKATWELMQQ